MVRQTRRNLFNKNDDDKEKSGSEIDDTIQTETENVSNNATVANKRSNSKTNKSSEKVKETKDMTKQLIVQVNKDSREVKEKTSDGEITDKEERTSERESRSESRSRSRSGSRKREKFPQTRFNLDKQKDPETVTTPIFTDEGSSLERRGKMVTPKYFRKRKHGGKGEASCYETETSSESSDDSSSTCTSSSSDSSDEEYYRRSRARKRKSRNKKRRKREPRKEGKGPIEKQPRKYKRQQSKAKQGSSKKGGRQYMNELAELKKELEKLKRKRSTSDSGEHVTPPNQKCRLNQESDDQIMKSLSDTAVYAPAVAKDMGSNATNRGFGNSDPQTAVNNTNANLITEFIKKIRISESTRTEREGDRADKHGRNSTEHELDEMADRNQQARLDAQATVVQAEKFRASLAPTGTVPSVSYHDPDDQFFHAICHIDPALKLKIQRGEFVELEKLLKKKTLQVSNQDQKLELFNHNGQAFLAPVVDKETKITNIYRWEQAFRAYATIYSQANPHRSAEIWQYVDVINRAARVFSWENVANYDYTFRQLMAENPGRSWGKIYTQMWNMTLCEPSNRLSHNTHPVTQNGNKASKRTGTCWRYNKNKCRFGTQCRYEHRCSYCLVLGHPAAECYKKNGAKTDGGEKPKGKKQVSESQVQA